MSRCFRTIPYFRSLWPLTRQMKRDPPSKIPVSTKVTFSLQDFSNILSYTLNRRSVSRFFWSYLSMHHSLVSFQYFSLINYLMTLRYAYHNAKYFVIIINIIT